MKELLADWHNLAPMAGLAILAAAGVFFWLRQKPVDTAEAERQRRAYLNRVGRIVEGQVLEVADHGHAAHSEKSSARKDSRRRGLFAKHPAALADGSRKLLYYTYAISGVTYETAQDVTGLEERLHLTRIAAGQTASVKYDPSNPSNSILLADDWSGLH
jgi:hypothetical protein